MRPPTGAQTVAASLWRYCWMWELLRAAAADTAPTAVAFTVAAAAAADDRPADSPAPQCPDASAGPFWPVFLTLLAVLLAALVAYLFWRHYWSIRHGKHLVLVTDVEKADPEYAFDNPGFREGTPVARTKKQSADTKENANQNDSNIEPKTKDQRQTKLSDNSLVSNSTLYNVIPLKGRDFAGLGFGINGSKRDGIFVKDLLHNGPASESGRIKSGDRIAAVRINFSDVECKDAEDILRSASPYEIEIEIEDGRCGTKRTFFREPSLCVTRSQANKLTYATGASLRNDCASSKPAIIQVVSEVADKVPKYGVKVLPEVGGGLSGHANAVVAFDKIVTNERQRATAAAASATAVPAIERAADNFDEVDLPLPSNGALVNENRVPRSNGGGGSNGDDKTTSQLVSSFKETNVKKALVQGYQNLKEKLAQRVHKSNSTTGSPKIEVNKMGAVSGAAGEGCPNEEDLANVEHIDLRLRSDSLDSGDEAFAPKASKRKAPKPPPDPSPDTSHGAEFNLLSEIDNEVKKHSAEDGSHSEAEAAAPFPPVTIELNASHITVHHGGEDVSRKAASLGDLSSITDNAPARAPPLERAVSLELAEHTPSAAKKRKAPRPPEEGAAVADGTTADALGGGDLGSGPAKLKKSSMFGTLEAAPPLFSSEAGVCLAPVEPLASKLKKSALFGTMEEAWKGTVGSAATADDDDDDDDDDGGGGSSFSLVASTPLKRTAGIRTDGWHYAAASDGQRLEADVIDVGDGDADEDVVPALPTSPIPSSTAPSYAATASTTFVTEIDVKAAAAAPVSSGNVAATVSARCDHEDVHEGTLFTTAAELTLSRTSDEAPPADGGAVCANGVAPDADGGATDQPVADGVHDSRDECPAVDTVAETSRRRDDTSSPPAPLSANRVPPRPPPPPPQQNAAVGVEIVAERAKPDVASSSAAATFAPADDHSPPTVDKFDEMLAPTLDTPVNGVVTDRIGDAAAVSTVPAIPAVSRDEPTRRPDTKANGRRGSSSSSSTTSGRSVTGVAAAANGPATRSSLRRFSSGGGGGGGGGSVVVETKIKSPNSTVKSHQLSQSVSPVRAVGSRIPVRANTEPSLKVSAIHHKDESPPAKTKKHDGAAENGKTSFHYVANCAVRRPS